MTSRRRLFGGFSLITFAFSLMVIVMYQVLVPNRQLIQQVKNIAADPFSILRADPDPADLRVIVFDASRHTGDLGFLDKAPVTWGVVVVNAGPHVDARSCVRCKFVEKSWVEDEVEGILPVTTSKILPRQTLFKMAAYMYVLSRGARWIYAIDRALPLPYKAMDMITVDKTRSAPVYQGPHDLFDPCVHFMDPFTWFGESSSKDWAGDIPNHYNLRSVKTKSVHAVVRGCCRKGMDMKKCTSAFDHQAPPAYILPGVFASIDFRNVLVSKESAWTLVASLDMQGDQSNSNSSEPSDRLGTSREFVSRTLLNLLIQRILWETNQNIGFYPTKMTGDEGCPTCAVTKSIASMGKDFREGLTNWRCNVKIQSVFDCLQRLATDIKFESKSRPEIQSLLHAWADLFRDQQVPLRMPMSVKKLAEKEEGTPLIFTPAKSMSKRQDGVTQPPCPYTQICTTPGKPYIPAIPTNHIIDHILLVVVMNYVGHVESIPYVDYLYGRHFKHVLYCSDDMDTFVRNYAKYRDATGHRNPVSFMEVLLYNGLWSQNCVSTAIKMNYDVKGYLHINDDMLINVWNINGAQPIGRPWFQNSLKIAPVDRQDVPDTYNNTYWWPWRDEYAGKYRATNAYKYLKTINTSKKVKTFVNNLHNVTNCKKCLLYERSDIYYVPKHLGEDFVFFSDIFTTYRVHIGITIPTVLVGITNDTHLYRLRGEYLLFEDGPKYAYFYSEYNIFLHPWKVTNFNDPQGKEFFCNTFLPALDNDALTRGGGPVVEQAVTSPP